MNGAPGCRTTAAIAIVAAACLPLDSAARCVRLREAQRFGLLRREHKVSQCAFAAHRWFAPRSGCLLAGEG